MTHLCNTGLDLADCSYIWASICIFVKFSQIDDHSSVPEPSYEFVLVLWLYFLVLFTLVFVDGFVLVFALVFSR